MKRGEKRSDNEKRKGDEKRKSDGAREELSGRERMMRKKDNTRESCRRRLPGLSAAAVYDWLADWLSGDGGSIQMPVHEYSVRRTRPRARAHGTKFKVFFLSFQIICIVRFKQTTGRVGAH
jgi:hypothetical protein